ncbi:ly6/PLAUR domain-containing protein 6B isoform X3 [Callorhinus ursinus]|uniref:ly6/PLAUR domain-containing protein 6B isoform X3 n=1 Tax=Callorhinus ursinus TaxID=34884 RepID=UPI003CD05212
MLPLRHALAVAVVQIFILSENWALAKNINFYNVRPPLDPTPFPNSFKCFTCENAGDNYNCNRWAEDKWCPQNTQYCLTVHHFTSHGRSTSITKKCASRSECHFVGCHHSRDSEHTGCNGDHREVEDSSSFKKKIMSLETNTNSQTTQLHPGPRTSGV